MYDRTLPTADPRSCEPEKFGGLSADQHSALELLAKARDAAGLGSEGFHTGSTVKIKEGGLHDADLHSPLMDWPKHYRFGPDLTDLANIREHAEPRQQIGGNEHRSSIQTVDLDLQMEDQLYMRSDLEKRLQPEHNGNSRIANLGEPGSQSSPSPQVTLTRYQIFIKTPERKTCLVWVHAESTIMQLKQQIWALTGYPLQIQHLVSGKRSLQDSRTMKNYEINPGTSIVLKFRLRGGALPQGQPSSSGGDKGKKAAPQQQPKGGSSYKNIYRVADIQGLLQIKVDIHQGHT